MKNILFLSLLCAALAAPAVAQEGTQPNPAGEPSATTQDAGGVPAKKAHGKKGGHPHIRHAKRALENAKKQLDMAAHDYGGHRAKAQDLVNQAIQELDAALQYAKDNPEGKK